MVCASVRSVASAAVLGMVALGSLLSSSGAHAAPLRANSAATVGDRAPTGHATWAAAALEELNVVSDAAVADIDAPAPLVYVEVTPPARVMHNNNVCRDRAVRVYYASAHLLEALTLHIRSSIFKPHTHELCPQHTRTQHVLALSLLAERTFVQY